MNFFEQQEHARRQTRTLILLFVLAVIAIVGAVNLVAALLWIWAQGGTMAGPYYYPKGFFLSNTLITVGLIVGGTMVETFNLREGGEAVAQMAGGRMISPATQDLQERRLLNVVEEMAIASSIACPKVFVLDKENSINAFAAGYNPNEAVVAVTRGTLNRLTRDELQGVVGHEFSHILNGDMRLNVRLIGVLFGIQMIAGFGQHLLNFGARFSTSRSRNDKGPPIQLVMLALGVALFVIGYIGIFFGRLIKSAVSRQREFLADASAVQFTRNPDGIGNALRKIGGLSRKTASASRIHHPNAEHLSHLFLSAIKPSLLSGMFATHPPINDRLRRIFGRNVELLEAPELERESPSAEILPDIPYVASGFAGTELSAAGTPIVAAPTALGKGATAASSVFPAPELENALHEPQAASAVVFALLLERGIERDAQMAVLQAELPHQAAFAGYLAQSIDKLPRSARLPLLDLSMPALRQLPESDRKVLLRIVEKLIAADNKITLAEFVLQTVLTRRLDPHAGRATPVKFNSLVELKTECAMLLSLVAHVAAAESAAIQHEVPALAFIRGIASCPELQLSDADLFPVSEIRFSNVKNALDRVNQLAPLAKPALIKALLAAASTTDALQVSTADMLRAICAAIDVPTPPAVAATYADFLRRV